MNTHLIRSWNEGLTAMLGEVGGAGAGQVGERRSWEHTPRPKAGVATGFQPIVAVGTQPPGLPEVLMARGKLEMWTFKCSNI